MNFNGTTPSAGPLPRAAAPTVGGPAGATAAEAPPFILPGSHFAAAFVFWLLGAAGLVVIAPDLVQGLYPLPRVQAVTHLFTLGWLTLSIQGALYQFLPVALHTPIRSQRAAAAGALGYVPGLVLFGFGVLENSSLPRLVGAALFGSALLGFVVNLALTLKRSAVRDQTWWSLAGAAVFLASTVILGAALAVNLGNGMLGRNRGLALAVHLHLAVFGWVLLVMIGVARHLLPMFLLSHGADLRPSRWALAGVGCGSAALLVLHHGPPVLARWLPGLLLALGAGAFLLQSAQFYRHRRRPRLDAGMRLAAAGLVLFGIGLLQGPLALAGGARATVAWTGYVATLLLGISLFVAGHYYKIVPFLVWFHRFGPLAGTRPLPVVAELFDARTAHAAALLLSTGALGLVLGIGVGSELAARVAAVVYAAGALLEGWQMLRLSRRRAE